MFSEFRNVYNAYRAPASLDGRPPDGESNNVVSLTSYRWNAHCRGLYQTPIAA
jgi:hypothetical protein